MHKATVIWDGKPQIIDVAIAEADPLIGMSLLYGFKLHVDVTTGGTVTIAAIN